jgi:hypothetical protein
MPERVTAREILRLRLHAQLLHGAPSTGVVSTVRHMLALQAQDFAQSLWAVGVRTPRSTRADVLSALESGEVVRTLPMRGTLHFVLAEDLGWMLGLTSARTLQGASTRFRNLGLEQSDLDRAEKLVSGQLAGGGSLSRDEFMKLLEANGISPEGQRAYHVIFYLCQRQVLCWGPPRGTQQALVLVDEWISRPRRLDHDDALREFALRYFTGHGPATVKDFSWWTKLTLKDARAGIESAGELLSELECGGVRYFSATTGLEVANMAPTGRRSSVHALPGFDEYLLGYQDRSLMLDAEHFQRIVPGNNGIFLPMIVSNGRIVGTWRRSRKGATIEPEHFAEASAALRTAFERETRAYERFVG